MHTTLNKWLPPRLSTRTRSSPLQRSTPPAHVVKAYKPYEKLQLESLPKPIVKLVKDYEPSCYCFEVFECVRKLIMVGLAIFFPSGSPEQLVFGLAMAFGTMAVYAAYRPFKSNEDDILALDRRSRGR